jgi:membrane protein DedA with SNARE-associated domain
MHIPASGGPPPLAGFLNSLAGPLDHFGYWAVLLLVMIEDFGIPVPGETVLIAAAVYAGAGRLNVAAVGVIGFAAAVIGDNIGFAIGHFGGRALVLRWGRCVRLTGERLDKARPSSTVTAPGSSRSRASSRCSGRPSGSSPASPACTGCASWPSTPLGAALWAGTWVSLGYLAGSHIDTIYHYIIQYSFYVLIALAVLLAGYIAWRTLRRSRHATPAREPANRQPSD